MKPKMKFYPEVMLPSIFQILEQQRRLKHGNN